MNESLNDIRQTIILTKYYSFDLGSYQIRELITKWTKLYPHHWLPLAVTEAIYQGRLKAVSVEQILNIWQKKGGISYSFNYEFIRLVQPDVNFKLQQEQELKDIFINQTEKLESPRKSPYNSSYRDYYENSSDHKAPTTNESVASIPQLNEFKPVDDYSQCFQKLKSLAINNNFDKHDIFVAN